MKTYVYNPLHGGRIARAKYFTSFNIPCTSEQRSFFEKLIRIEGPFCSQGEYAVVVDLWEPDFRVLLISDSVNIRLANKEILNVYPEGAELIGYKIFELRAADDVSMFSVKELNRFVCDSVFTALNEDRLLFDRLVAQVGREREQAMGAC